MYTDDFQKIGLSKNEARIYETLLIEGSSAVGHIALKSEVHRRNVYDSLDRLIDKGLVYEVRNRGENLYEAADPDSLIALLDEKREALDDILPALDALYQTKLADYAVYKYEGKEGWKNYMRDILRVGEPVHFIGAKGGWLDKRVKDFFPHFIKEAEKKKIPFYHLFDYGVQKEVPEILQYVGDKYKFLPKEFSAPSSIDIFGDHVNIITEIHMGKLSEEIVFSVIVNKSVAKSFRTWFQMIWDLSKSPKTKANKKKNNPKPENLT